MQHKNRESASTVDTQPEVEPSPNVASPRHGTSTYFAISPPILRIASLAMIAALVVVALGGFALALLQTAEHRRTEAIQAQNLLVRILRLQEATATATRLELLSETAQTTSRAESVHLSLNDSVNTLAQTPLLKGRHKALIRELSDLNRSLRGTERRAHLQATSGRQEQARALLSSSTYEQQRQRFEQTTAQLSTVVESELSQTRQLFLVGTLALTGCALLASGSLVSIGLVLHRTRRTLMEETQRQRERIQRAEAELKRTHQQVHLLALEAERTAQARQVQEKRLRQSAEMHRQLRMQEQAIEAANDVIMIAEVADTGLRVVRVNRAFYRMTGYTDEEILGNSPRILQGEDTDQETVEFIRRHIRAGEPVEAELLNYRKDGTPFWVQLNIQPVFENGHLRYWMSIQRDVTERKRIERELRWQATHDPLTRLPNRAYYEEQLGYAIAHCEERRSLVGVLFIDLDNFKDVNDSLGHDAGDRLLEQVATRLKGSLPKDSMLARFGGDEFTVLLYPLDTPDRAEKVAQRLLDVLDAAPFHLNNLELTVTASIGVSIAPTDGRTITSLLKNADTAMYRAKDQGRDSLRIYNESMNSRVLDRLQIENQLRRALDRGEFTLLYQPQVEVSTGRLCGVEALLRWENPVLGKVSPGLFIPIAEESDIIVEIGGWAMREACRQGAEWHRQGRDIRVSVNLSARQFTERGLAESVRDALETFRLPNHLLDLELTETALINEKQAIGTLRRLKSIGVRLSVDDFGMRHSVLSYISRLPLDILKIDKFFVTGIDMDRRNQVMVRLLIEMAQELKLEVIAEGVETEAERQTLVDMGCHLIQGYLFSRPITASEVESFYDRASVAFVNHETARTIAANRLRRRKYTEGNSDFVN